ncbi:MAG: GMC family oxidoreductase [Pedobacter sp.]|nr:GMC family oxidoreductase [Pedobacter sp.]
MSTEIRFDAIVVGSGFGGAVTAARLAEAGWKVLVLERGRRWLPQDMPRGPGDDWFYDVDEPHKQNGWLDYRWFGDMSVAMGAGVGGGSLIYGNVSIIPPRTTFDKHWPAAINYDALQPHYETVGKILNIQEMPLEQVPKRFDAMKKGAAAIGASSKFQLVPLAVTFDPRWDRNAPDPYNDDKSHKFINAQGREQGTCNHCGFCCSGCHLKAKNTLDLNYLAIAEDHGADIRPLHVVNSVERLADGYRVHAIHVDGGKSRDISFTASKVILSAGSLGSTEILLRSRDEKKYLPQISKKLGEGWSSNGDFLTFSSHKEEMLPTRSPTISCAINFLDGDGYEGARIFVEDGALGDVPVAYFGHALMSARKWLDAGWYKNLLNKLIRQLGRLNTAEHTIAWFAQSVDASDGRLCLKKSWAHFGRLRLHLDWDIKKSEDNFKKVNELHKKLARANDPVSITTLPTWTLLRDLTTPHPLGGCRMADSQEQGVVDHRGEVFGYPGLYVADGAIIPFALGINPSRTIAALAERNVAIMLAEAGKA